MGVAFCLNPLPPMAEMGVVYINLVAKICC